MSIRILSVLAAVLLLSSCAITQTANPVLGLRKSSEEICAIEKRDLRAEFSEELRSALESRAMSLKMLPPGSPLDSCPVTISYNAKWSWDFVTYMAWAEILVYRDGKKAGDALYAAPRAGWAMTFRIYESTKSKVDTMVDQLFPAN